MKLKVPADKKLHDDWSGLAKNTKIVGQYIETYCAPFVAKDQEIDMDDIKTLKEYCARVITDLAEFQQEIKKCYEATLQHIKKSNKI